MNINNKSEPTSINVKSERGLLESLDEWHKERWKKAEKICNIIKSFSQNKHYDPLIVDVGCHEGRMEAYFSTCTNNVIIGIDNSFDFLKIASSKRNELNLKNVSFVLADAKSIPIRDNKVDWIICNHVIDYLDDKKKVFQEFDRLLKLDGMLYLAVISRSFLKIYKMFPFVFSRLVGPFYGRSSPSTKSQFGTPMDYNYWKKKILENVKLGVNDITPILMSKAIFGNTDSNNSKLLSEIQYFICSYLSRFSGSWVFLYQKK